MAKKKTFLIPEDDADQFVKDLPFATQEQGSYDVKDSVSKLIVTVYQETKTFRWRNTFKPSKPYEKIDPRANAETMTVEEARDILRKLRSKLKEGKAPIIDPDTEHPRCLTLLEHFELAMKELVGNQVNKKGSVDTKRSAIMSCGPKFYNRTLTDFTEQQLIAKATWFRNKYGKTYFDNFHSAIFSTFDHAYRASYPIGQNTAAAIKTVTYRKKDITSDKADVPLEQIVAFRTEYMDHPDCTFSEIHRRMLMCELYTGQRGNSTSCMEWTDFDWCNGWLIIPVEKQKHSVEHKKNYRPVYVDLNEFFLNEILGISGREEAEQRARESRWVFPSVQKKRKDKDGKICKHDKPDLGPRQTLNNAFKVRSGKPGRMDRYQVLRHQKLPLPAIVEKFTPHEFGRHSFATLADEAGIPGKYISLMMGHLFSKKQIEKDPDLAAPTTSGTYIHTKVVMETLREWWTVWAKSFAETLNMPVPQSVMDDFLKSKAAASTMILKEVADACGGDMQLALEQITALINKGQLNALRLIKGTGTGVN